MTARILPCFYYKETNVHMSRRYLSLERELALVAGESQVQILPGVSSQSLNYSIMKISWEKYHIIRGGMYVAGIAPLFYNTGIR